MYSLFSFISFCKRQYLHPIFFFLPAFRRARSVEARLVPPGLILSFPARHDTPRRSQSATGVGNCARSTGNTTTITRLTKPRKRSLGNLYNNREGNYSGNCCRKEVVRESIFYLPTITPTITLHIIVRIAKRTASRREREGNCFGNT